MSGNNEPKQGNVTKGIQKVDGLKSQKTTVPRKKIGVRYNNKKPNTFSSVI